MKRLLAGALAAGVLLMVPSVAFGSQLLTRNATTVKLLVNSKGEALITFKANGKPGAILAWGAVNARPPSTVTPQVEFKLNYKPKTAGFTNRCTALSQVVQWQVAACQASDGSYWALQAWQRMLPN